MSETSYRTAEKKPKKTVRFMLPVQTAIREDLQEEPAKLPVLPATNAIKVCEFDAITIENNLAYIDAYKCTFCRKCASNARQMQ